MFEQYCKKLEINFYNMMDRNNQRLVRISNTEWYGLIY